jgi:hypothetical protein
MTLCLVIEVLENIPGLQAGSPHLSDFRPVYPAVLCVKPQMRGLQADSAARVADLRVCSRWSRQGTFRAHERRGTGSNLAFVRPSWICRQRQCSS